MNIEILNNYNLNDIDEKVFKEMIFLYNALENGWKIKKNKNTYIFSKKHENKKEIFNDNYLMEFIKKNININDYNDDNIK